MQDGPPSSSEDANASVVGVPQSAVRCAALGGVDQGGRREADQDRPVTVGGHRRQQRGHRRGAVLARDAAADDEVVLRARLECRRQHLRAVGGQRVDPVDLLVDVEVEPEVVEQDHADHGGQGQDDAAEPASSRARGGPLGSARVPASLTVGRAAGAAAPCPGNGGIGPLRREGRLSGSHDGRRLDRTGHRRERRPGGRPPGTGGRPGWRTAPGDRRQTGADGGRRVVRDRLDPRCGLLDAAGGAAAADGTALTGEQLLDGHRLGVRRLGSCAGGCARGRRGHPRRPASAVPPPVSTPSRRPPFPVRRVRASTVLRPTIRGRRRAPRRTRGESGHPPTGEGPGATG